jgi:hypothetical protein
MASYQDLQCVGGACSDDRKIVGGGGTTPTSDKSLHQSFRASIMSAHTPSAPPGGVRGRGGRFNNGTSSSLLAQSCIEGNGQYANVASIANAE